MFQLPYTKVIEAACMKAGKVIKRDFGEVENLQVSKKGPGNFVTSCDLKVEKILIEEIQKSFPKFSIVSEETGNIKGESDKITFIIDPIDGTTNFMHGIPFFAISIGVLEKTAKGNELLAGVVYNPILDEFYHAERGQGAYCNSRRLFASGRDDYDMAIFSSYIARNNEEYRKRDLHIQSQIKTHTRVIGSAAMELAYVAAGKIDGMWHHNLKPWDIAAGMILVREAKGIVSEIDGGKNSLKSGNIIAANPNIFENLRSKLQECTE